MNRRQDKEALHQIMMDKITEKLNRKGKRKCICNVNKILRQIKGIPYPLDNSDINKIRLNLFTERNSDGTGYLVLRGNDMMQRYGRRICDDDLRAIILYVREASRRITRLDLSYNEISDLGFARLLKRLLVKERSSINNLNIMMNGLTALSLKFLSQYATLIRLKYLRLNGNKFGTCGGGHLAQILLKNSTVEFLDVGETDQTLTSVADIFAALRTDSVVYNTTVRCLDFSRIVPLFDRYNVETKWLAYHVELLLENNSTLEELHLQKNEFLSHDIEYIIRGLRCNITIKYLDLGYNKIGDYGAELLGNYLKGNPSLVLLNIAGNGIQDTGARALSFGLPYSQVRALDISKNRMTDNGVIDILNTLKKFCYMRFLNIWGNKIGHNSCVIIERMLLSGVLFQHTIDVSLYEVDDVLYAAYYPNPADRNKHRYYCELEYGSAQPIYNIKRNQVQEPQPFYVDCRHRQKLHKTDRNTFL